MHDSMHKEEENVIALVGKPASGKNTITDMLEELGVPCKSTGNIIRDEAEEMYSNPNEREIWEVARNIRDEYGNSSPTKLSEDWLEEKIYYNNVVCISGLRHEEELTWLRNNYSNVLSVLVEVPREIREKRYIEREIGEDVEEGVVDEQKITSLRKELRDREKRESPYPDYDVVIQNYHNESMYDMYVSVKNLIDVIS